AFSVSGSTIVIQPTGGLEGNKQYTITVSGTIQDIDRNAFGSDVSWSFTTRPFSFVDSTVNDFNAGTTGANTFVSTSYNAGVVLTPGIGVNFTGNSLASGWSSSSNAGGSATVGSGMLTLDGATAGTTATYGSGRSLDFMATFSGDPYQHVGLAVD